MSTHFRCAGCNNDKGIEWRVATSPDLCDRCHFIVERVRVAMNDPACPWCDRLCGGCGAVIPSGFVHVAQPQPEGASHIVHSQKRNPPGPLAAVLNTYFDHHEHHVRPHAVDTEPL